VERVLGGALRPGRELDVLALLLARLEREPLEADPRLTALRASFTEGDRRASRAIAALARRASIAEWARNQLFAPLAFLLGWRLQSAFAVESWRLAHGARVRGWLAALGEVEALSSLAGYAREHPADSFAEVGEGPPRFAAEGLAHPLLPADRAVANDVALGPGTRLLVVSGSNMSGKSTMLRTLGVNAVLALAGAPVRARRLAMTPVAIGATLRIQDSLQGGRSRFYAEIERLKQLADLARGTPPLLFLLDELLHGTNSHDRLVGAEAVLRELLARGAIGLATTHDLALTAAAARLPEAANAHFEDRVEDGRIAFDYRLRPGVVERSNALALMRAVGLEV
jgi:DNA mismatch repair ATPase MutS